MLKIVGDVIKQADKTKYTRDIKSGVELCLKTSRDQILESTNLFEQNSKNLGRIHSSLI